MWNALKFYFRLVEGNNTKVGKIIRPKKKDSIPLVYSPSQVKMVADSVENLKHQTIIYTLYGTGVRKEELINIELSHINRYRNSIRVIGGKGEKDRETFCDDFLLNQITKYWRIFKPKKYLFENDNGSQYSSSSVYNVVKNSFAKFGLKASPHTLRHCFATHLLEADISPRKVQKSMGHKRLETLQIYSGLINIGSVSPLSLLHK